MKIWARCRLSVGATGPTDNRQKIKKVSWPPRKEYVGSSFVVVVVVVVISLFLHFVDKGLSALMAGLGIGF